MWRDIKASEVQIDGDHYKKYPIQPAEYCFANNIPTLEGLVIKYITRWRDKGGVNDLEKAKHCINMILEFEKKYETISSPGSIQSPQVEPEVSYGATVVHVGQGWAQPNETWTTPTAQGTKECNCSCGSDAKDSEVRYC